MDWQCPFCGRHATIGEDNAYSDTARCSKDSVDGPIQLESLFIVCPSRACRKTALTIILRRAKWQPGLNTWALGAIIFKRDLLPASRAQALPPFIPAPIVADYNEACLIETLSPKASATLSRRCLQGILRDYWKVKPGKLYNEIEEVKDKMDPATWDAIDAVRKVGNIGAHMEKDIDVIVDVEPQEAALLIGLIETVIKDWYIIREERRVRLEQIKQMAVAKDAKKASA